MLHRESPPHFTLFLIPFFFSLQIRLVLGGGHRCHLAASSSQRKLSAQRRGRRGVEAAEALADTVGGVQRRSALGRAGGSNNEEEKQQISCVDSRRPPTPPNLTSTAAPTTLLGDAAKAPAVRVVLCVQLVFIYQTFLFFSLSPGPDLLQLESVFKTIVIISRSRLQTFILSGVSIKRCLIAASLFGEV